MAHHRGKLALVMLGAVCAASAQPPGAPFSAYAEAQGRSAAPVVYAGQGGTRGETAGVEAHQGGRTAGVVSRERARIAFIYPEIRPDNGAGDVAVADAAPAAPAPAAPVSSSSLASASMSSSEALSPAPQPATSAGPSIGGRSGPAAAITPVAGPAFDEVGMASWYGEAFHGRPTANGETFDMNALTAAHPTLPLPSLVQVVNVENGREVVVRVNDRGPFIEGRILDLSRRAAEALDFVDQGETEVRVRYLGPAPVAGSVQGTDEGPSAVAPPQAPVAVDPSPVSGDAQAVPTRTVPTQLVPEATRARQAVRPDAQGSVFVQLGAFSSISNAERLKSTLSPGLPVAVRPVRVNGADFFRVLVGPWPDTQRAEAVKADLVSRNMGEGLVVSNP
ncbi:MAG: septal ring lytic transglycosylase RlpA family protein [Pseudomonadota bacterium]